MVRRSHGVSDWRWASSVTLVMVVVVRAVIVVSVTVSW